ncbi:MAG TPA: oxidoreductase, partial [Ruminococcaceae bacterium]|nr:oxidoreductase [Oscillospiraceae bacterium]
VVQENLEILDQMTPESTASLQKDLKRGQKSEMDGLIFEVIRLGEKYRVPVPTYWK